MTVPNGAIDTGQEDRSPERFRATVSALEAAGFAVDGLLSEGDSMALFTAWDLERDCPCTVKMLGPGAARDSTAVDRLRREGTLLYTLRHPHLVPCYQVIETAAGPAVELQTLVGHTLSRLIEDDYPAGMPTDEITVLARQLLSAVHYLHQSGYLHLDIKPSNIIANAGSAVLIDLSLARKIGPCPGGLGTIQYMAPEQLTGGDLTPAADVWGLGATLFRAATSLRPFDSDRKWPAAQPDLGLLDRKTVAPWLAQLIGDCLVQRPGERPDLAEVRERLDKYYDEIAEAEWASEERNLPGEAALASGE